MALVIIVLSAITSFELNPPAQVKVGSVQVQGELQFSSGTASLANGRVISTALAGGPFGIRISAELQPFPADAHFNQDIAAVRKQLPSALLLYSLRVVT